MSTEPPGPETSHWSANAEVRSRPDRWVAVQPYRDEAPGAATRRAARGHAGVEVEEAGARTPRGSLLVPGRRPDSFPPPVCVQHRWRHRMCHPRIEPRAPTMRLVDPRTAGFTNKMHNKPKLNGRERVIVAMPMKRARTVHGVGATAGLGLAGAITADIIQRSGNPHDSLGAQLNRQAKGNSDLALILTDRSVRIARYIAFGQYAPNVSAIPHDAVRWIHVDKQPLNSDILIEFYDGSAFRARIKRVEDRAALRSARDHVWQQNRVPPGDW